MVKLSKKQKSVMNVVIRGNGDGSFVDVDQILERIDYETSKQAMQFTLRYMEQKGVISKEECEKRRGARRRIIAPTTLGYQIMRGSTTSSEDDKLLI